MSGPHDPSAPFSREVTAELLERYDQPGPRYTSYPTAVEFVESVDGQLYEQRLAEADRLPDEPWSVYLHLPFCEERCLFCGCHVIISPRKERARPYLDLLRREIDMVAERVPHRRRVSQLHLGGGTPTYHSPGELKALLEHFFAHFEVAPGAELAVEIDPRVTSFEHIDVLGELGFNRVSMGLQDLTEKVQQAVGRIQSGEQTARLVEHARRRGYTGTNIDLIYGLPHQDPDTFERTVEAVIDMGADRSAVYSFAYVPWIRGHQKKIDTEALPGRDTKFALFAVARERFLRAGYEAIGMDHFAKPDDELSVAKREGRLRRNFQGYTVIPAADVLGLGISAIGDVRGAYVQNLKKLSQYERAIDAGRLPVERGVVRSAEDELRRDVIHDLMCNFKVDVRTIEQRHGIDFATHFAPDLELLRAHERENLVRIGPDRIEATPTGELFIRNLARCFDLYWRDKHEGEERPVFSRTV